MKIKDSFKKLMEKQKKHNKKYREKMKEAKEQLAIATEKTEGQKKFNKKIDNLSKNFQKMGCLLTLLITIPIILTIFLGIPGLIIGIIIIIFVIYFSFKKKNKIMVVNSYKEAESNKEFRLKTDKPNVIRVFQDRPDKLSRELSRGVKVSGTSYRQEVVEKFIEGKNKKVEIEYSPTEKYPQSIKVLGLWEDETGYHKEQIGYVEDEVALRIYEEFKNLPVGATLWTIYKPYKDKGTGIRICIWCPSNNQKFVRKAE